MSYNIEQELSIARKKYMNHWTILRRAFLYKKAKPRFAVNVQRHNDCEILGEVFIGENTNIGKSKIISKTNSIISIGRNVNIRDQILIYADESGLGKLNNILIGNKVFISSDVEIYGPAVISDEIFIGNKTMIVNSEIGKGCLIEDNVLIKNIIIPSNTVIPSRSVIDSKESLHEVINSSNQECFCEVFFQRKGGDLLCF